VHPGTQVSKTQDRQTGLCIFSINGAVATSPPPRQVIDAINFLRDRSRPMMRDPKGFVAAIAAVMAASAPAEEVPQELIAILNEFGGRLTECVNRFFSADAPRGTDPDQRAQASDTPVTCTAIAAYTDERAKHEIVAGGGTAVGIPTLAIAARWAGGRFVSTAYVPIVTPGQPPLPLQ
jgi:hypothetical protein